jgi:hypothetical protein
MSRAWLDDICSFWFLLICAYLCACTCRLYMPSVHVHRRRVHVRPGDTKAIRTWPDAVLRVLALRHGRVNGGKHCFLPAAACPRAAAAVAVAVQILNMSYTGIGGLPSDWSDLPGLAVLDLSMNNIKGRRTDWLAGGLAGKLLVPCLGAPRELARAPSSLVTGLAPFHLCLPIVRCQARCPPAWRR